MFWKEHSYHFVRMFLNQATIGLFGLVLYIATLKAGNEPLMLCLGIGSLIFYLFMVYNTAWEIGSKDFTPVSAGRKQAKPMTGFLVSLVSYFPSFLTAAFLIVGSYLDNGFTRIMTSVSALISMIIDGMYLGIISFGHTNGETVWVYFYLLAVIPGLTVSSIAYLLGLKGIRLLPVGKEQYPLSDRPTKAELKKDREQNIQGKLNKK